MNKLMKLICVGIYVSIGWNSTIVFAENREATDGQESELYGVDKDDLSTLPGGRAIIGAKIDCPCSATKNGLKCPYEETVLLSIIRRDTGATVWGPELASAPSDDRCQLVRLIGATVPVDETVLNAPSDDYWLHVKCTAGCPIKIQNVPYVISQKGIKGDTGSRGPSGAAGVAGAKGDAGIAGAIGPTGLPGMVGPAGAKGDAGAAGAKGDAGAAGAKGDAGAAGAIGPTGLPGMVGPAGAKGDAGAAGAKGDAGIAGAKGDTGIAGAKGDAGIAGAIGPTGLPGMVGPAGAAGIAGAKGDAGAAGAIGPTGLPGMVGPAGAAGASGAIGPTGLPGKNGSEDVIFTEGEGGIISVTTPQFTGQWFNEESVNNFLDDKAPLHHAHSTSDISDVAKCVGPVTDQLCMNDDSSLQVKGVKYVPAPLINGVPIRMEYFSGIKTGSSNSWNVIGNIGAGNKTIRHIEGSVKSIQGTDLIVNSSDRMRIRIVDKRIEEFHTDFALNSQEVIIIIHYTSL